MDIKEFIEKDINNIWGKFNEYEFTNIPPLAIKEVFCENSILFIGLNPSLSNNEFNRLNYNQVNQLEFYPNHRKIDKPHKYFNKFIEISKNTILEWDHLDLLYIRETKQSKILDILKTKKGIDFIYQQLKITKKIIEHLIETERPKMFVVNNTLSRVFLGKDKNDWLGFNFRWDNEIGTYTYKNIPFFFSSMLTGQRALDIGSFERLVWHINHIKNK